MEQYFQNVFYKRLLAHSYFILSNNEITDWSFFEEKLGKVSKDLPQHIKDFLYQIRDKDQFLNKSPNKIGFVDILNKQLSERFENEYPKMSVNYNSLYFKDEGVDYTVMDAQFSVNPANHKTRRLFDFHLFPFEHRKVYFWIIQPNVRKLTSRHTDYVLGQTNNIDVRNVVIAPTLDFDLISKLTGFAKNALLAADFFSIFKLTNYYPDKKRFKIDENLDFWDKFLNNQNHGVINIDKFIKG
jgi:hypothetical protein